jgi:hypothetical protein
MSDEEGVMLNLTVLNWYAIVGATLAAFALGGLWYGPLFGKAWMSAIGKTADELQPPPLPYVISFFTALVTTIVLAMLINALGVVRVIDGVLLGAIVGIGFIATAMASDNAFCGWGLKLFLIQSGYRVVYSLIIGAILAFWR